MRGVQERQIRYAHAILSSLFSKHVKSLDEESLLTLAAEIKGILNSLPLTVENISISTSDLFLAPSSILTMKSNVVLPRPGDCSRSDLYCSKRWHVQHTANEFWSHQRKEYLQTAQVCTKQSSGKRNFSVGDIVSVLQDESVHNQWPWLIHVFKDSNGHVHVETSPRLL